MSDDLKLKLLAGLVVVFVGMLTFRLATESEPQRVPLTHKSGQVATPEHSASLPSLKQQGSRNTKPAKVTRHPSQNIFAPLEFPKPKRKKARKAKPRAAPPPPPKPVAAPLPVGPTPGELAGAQARKLMAQYRVLGYAIDGGELQAFLGKGTKIFIVGVGETLEGRIQIAEITDTAVKLRETRTNLETTLAYKKAGQ